MIETALGYRGAFSAPHRQAALVGRDILEAGGTAIEAMVAAAAMIAVTYPHMNGIGGDGFWIIKKHGELPVGISACGRAAALATTEWYAERGHETELPARGGNAALTVPATIRGWEAALSLVDEPRLALDVLLHAAIDAAQSGIAVTRNQVDTTAAKLSSLEKVPGFADVFLPGFTPPAPGARFVQPALARTLTTLAKDGLDAFYRGAIAERHAAFLVENDSPLRLEDFAGCRADYVTPLAVNISRGTLFNMPPPTQGVSSLMMLAMYDRIPADVPDGFDHVHRLVEMTKQAFTLRNRELADPDFMPTPAGRWLTADMTNKMAGEIDLARAKPWPEPSIGGDTIWMGCVDRAGTVVSFIQSVFWEYGSGLTCPDTGVYFQNRGAGFSLRQGPNQLAPGKRPFHTLNPALAVMKDGSVMAYGTMGGEGQPQTQAALFSRYAWHGVPLQEAITRPRWLLGKTWGDVNTSLKLESRFDPKLVNALEAAGHDVEIVAPYCDLMGHAGAVVRHENGLIEAATDPRCDGAALAS